MSFKLEVNAAQAMEAGQFLLAHYKDVANYQLSMAQAVVADAAFLAPLVLSDKIAPTPAMAAQPPERSVLEAKLETYKKLRDNAHPSVQASAEAGFKSEPPQVVGPGLMILINLVIGWLQQLLSKQQS